MSSGNIKTNSGNYRERHCKAEIVHMISGDKQTGLFSQKIKEAQEQFLTLAPGERSLRFNRPGCDAVHPDPVATPFNSKRPTKSRTVKPGPSAVKQISE